LKIPALVSVMWLLKFLKFGNQEVARISLQGTPGPLALNKIVEFNVRSYHNCESQLRQAAHFNKESTIAMHIAVPLR